MHESIFCQMDFLCWLMVVLTHARAIFRHGECKADTWRCAMSPHPFDVCATWQKFTSDTCLRMEKNGKLQWDACVFLFVCDFLFCVDGISTNYSAKCLGGLICDLVRDAVID